MANIKMLELPAENCELQDSENLIADLTLTETEQLIGGGPFPPFPFASVVFAPDLNIGIALAVNVSPFGAGNTASAGVLNIIV